jgi:hypothetical protein
MLVCPGQTYYQNFDTQSFFIAMIIFLATTFLNIPFYLLQYACRKKFWPSSLEDPLIDAAAASGENVMDAAIVPTQLDMNDPNTVKISVGPPPQYLAVDQHAHTSDLKVSDVPLRHAHLKVVDTPQWQSDASGQGAAIQPCTAIEPQWHVQGQQGTSEEAQPSHTASQWQGRGAYPLYVESESKLQEQSDHWQAQWQNDVPAPPPRRQGAGVGVPQWPPGAYVPGQEFSGLAPQTQTQTQGGEGRPTGGPTTSVTPENYY